MVRVREVRRGVFFTAVGCFITGWIIKNFLRFCFNSLKPSLILLLFGGYDILVFFIHVKIKIRWASWIWQGQSTELQSLFLKYSLAPPRHCNSRNIDFYFSKTCQNKKEDMKSHSFDICTCKNLHSLIIMHGLPQLSQWKQFCQLPCVLQLPFPLLVHNLVPSLQHLVENQPGKYTQTQKHNCKPLTLITCLLDLELIRKVDIMKDRKAGAKIKKCPLGLHVHCFNCIHETTFEHFSGTQNSQLTMWELP